MLDQSQTLPCADRPDPVPLILGQLARGNDVIRTDAVRAAARQSTGDNRVRRALLDCLLDEDPDVRTDAMDALVEAAQPGDGATLRRSLAGDPVREVKLAAIRALARIGDAEAIPLLRRLALSRCEEDVAWEDDIGAWDEWLEIQVAAIDALGVLNAVDAIEDILAARDDEDGQVLDGPVFAALAAMGETGAVWLLSVAQTETGLSRARSLAALAGTTSELMADYLEEMLADAAADIRNLAVSLLPDGDPRITALALSDPAEEVRLQALRRSGAARPGLAVQALRDVSPRVQALALDHLALPLDAEMHETVLANCMAWLLIGKAPLKIAAARILPRLAPDQAADPLLTLVRDTVQPLDARLAAVSALGTLSGPVATERMITLLGDETRQVRTMALTCLADLCRAGDAAAGESLAMAMNGTLLAPEQAVVQRADGAESGPDLAMPKADAPPAGHLVISRDGDIIETGPGDVAPAGQSTLASIQIGAVADPEPELAGETPEETAPKRRRRRPVEGPDDVADDLRLVALGIAGDCPDTGIAQAVAEAAQGADDALRQAAWRALLGRCDRTPDIADLAVKALRDENPAVRTSAAELLAQSPETAGGLAPCLEDGDALVRALAVRHCASDAQALAALADPARPVRDAALNRVLCDTAGVLPAEVFQTLYQGERIDTLAAACERSGPILTLCLQALSPPDLSPRQAHILLQALGR